MSAKFRIEIADEPLEEPSNLSKRLYSSTSSKDSGIEISPRLETIVDEMLDSQDLTIKSGEWPTDAADLILKVGETSLFLVHRMVLWRCSELLKTILESITITESDDFDMFTLQGVQANDVEDILPFFYDQFREIDEIEVLNLLRIARIFEAENIVRGCESCLIDAHDVYPLDLIKTAKEYNLETLLATAIRRASKLPNITRYMDFDDLDWKTQNKIQTTIARKQQQRLLFQPLNQYQTLKKI